MRDSIRLANRPIMLFAFATALVVSLAAGNTPFRPGTAHADVQLEMSGSCEPDIRPNEPALVSCTVTVTNNGTEAATDLNGSVFIAEDCQIPNRFSFIDRTYNDTLERTLPQGLAFDVPDVGPGVTASSTTRIATENFSTGATGGSVTISSSSQPSVSATVDLCWNVSASAGAPPTDLRVTKSPLGFGDDVPEPPTVDPDIGGDAIVDPPLPPEGAAQFEIVVTNTGNDTISNVSLLDVSTGSAVFLESDPPATLDELGRPTWDADGLAPGQEFRALVSFAAAPDSSCSYADGVAIVNATGPDGQQQDYVAFADSGIQVGPCLPYPDGYCAHYAPGGEQATLAPCDDSVCWSTAPDGYMAAVYGCEDVDYCWFTPPGSGSDVIQPCEEAPCWFSFGEVFLAGDFPPSDYYSQVPCDQQFCTYTSPDGVSQARGQCDFPVCWAQHPIADQWQEVYGCGQFEGSDSCWFVAPDETSSIQSTCDDEFCWVSFQFDFNESFYEPVPCEGYSFCDFTSPDGLSTVTNDCDYPTCWSMAPGSAQWTQVYDCDPPQAWCWFAPPGAPDLSILEWCNESVDFAVNVPDGGIVSSPWQTRLYDSDTDWCWPIPPSSGSFEAFVTFCEDIDYISWFQLDDGSWISSYGPNPGCGDLRPPGGPDGPAIPLPVQPQGGVDIIAPCLPDDELAEGVPGDVVPVESVSVEGVQAEVVGGAVESIDPQPSSLVEPLEIVEGQVEQFDPIPSVATTPANLVPSESVQEIDANFPGDVIVLPIDGGGPAFPPFPTDGSDRDETITTPNDPDDVIVPGDDNNNLVSNPDVETKQTDNVSSLPNAGARARSSDGIPTWVYAALVAFGVLSTGFAYRRLRLKA